MNQGDTNRSPLAILNWMASTLDRLTKLCFLLSGTALTLILFSVIIEVTKRYFFNAPTDWSVDMNKWLLALTIMLALPEITRTKGNIAITVLVEKMSEHKRNIVHRTVALVAFGFCLMAVWICGAETFRQYSNGIYTLWINPIPKWWMSVVIPFGFLVSGAQFLREGIMPQPSGEAQEN